MMRKYMKVALVSVVNGIIGATLMTMGIVWREHEATTVAEVMRNELFMTWGVLLCTIGIVLLGFAACGAKFHTEVEGTKP